MKEQWRELRGHSFLPDPYILHNIPRLYATEDVPVLEKTIYIHYSIPASQLPFDWWIAELDQEEGLAFGYACLHGDTDNAEWGYISLTELEGIMMRGNPPALVERDLEFKPTKWASVVEDFSRRS